MKPISSTLDLFSDCPAPVVETAKPRSRRQTPPAELPVAVSAAPRAGNLAPTLGSLPPEEGLEAMAQRLEQSSNYRVLRRLQPRVVWPDLPSADPMTLLVLDTETTGLDSTRERIIELGMLRLRVDRITGIPMGPVQVFDGLEDPGKPIPPEVVAITGITDDKVRGQRLDEQRIADLLDGVELVIAHNAGFDRPFVEGRLPAFAQMDWACSFAEVDWKTRGRTSSKLENLAHAVGLFYDAHRADVDCHALLAVLAQDGDSADAETPLQELLTSASRTSYRVHANRSPFEAKDLLKTRGYRWNAEQKVWSTSVSSEDALAAEQQWLAAHVYGPRGGSIGVEALDARSRYSSRGGALREVRL